MPPGRPVQWTVPNLDVLPDELIGDAFDRPCCQHLRINPTACPVSFLGAMVIDEPGLVQYVLTLNISGEPHTVPTTWPRSICSVS
ncbi:hypothetical protein [Streptomyces sp. ISL-11]|uniref:hypothetical protein n=1 Tax=Streptomyces sp. ISL-11 TaxID=2819174 RepID=UPI001BE77889|nr:hypothetical protein [Streptomyces sp. ISL-11]MBT2385883.1 hypothetical protein [Streptomyces sp. ISL-11]